MALHELRGSGAPSTAPTQLNQHYLDIVSGDLYLSKGTSSSADWVLLSTSSSAVTSFNGRTGAVSPAPGDYTYSDVGADASGAAATVQGNLTTHIGDTANPHAVTKSQVGLGNADNTSDVNKPISTATQTALNGKEPSISTGTTGQYWRGDKTFQTLDKSAVGLGNVDNTSDVNKPISTATQTALNAKVTANTAITGDTHLKITYDSKGLVTSGVGATLDDLDDVILTTPVLDEVIRFNGSHWVNDTLVLPTSGSNGVNYFLSSTASGISTYDLMSKTPDSAAEVDETIAVTSASGLTLFEGYISDTALFGTQIDPGIWEFNIYTYVSLITGTNTITLDVYSRTSGGTETLLFSDVSPSINSSTVELVQFTSVQPAYIINSTDKLLFKFSVQTTNVSNTTFHLVHSGNLHYSYVNTPLLTRHNQLAGLQGGTTGEQYHSTLAEYTGTGTGIFVRTNSPNIITPTGIVKADIGLANVDNVSDVNKPVSTATQTALNLKANLASPALTGTPTAPTAANGTNTTQIATTAFVLANGGSTADATTTTKGIVQLAGDLSGTAASPTVPGLAGKESTITAGTTGQYWRGDKTFQTLDKAAVGLSNVDNTSDTAKAIAGDVTGTLGSSTVEKLQNRTVATTAPTSGQSLTWNSGTSQWEPQTVGGGAGITSITTSASALTLTSSSNTYQLFTGTVHGQSVILPDATTLSVGSDFFLANKSDTIIPVYYNGGVLAGTLYPDSYLECLVMDISSAAGKWVVETAVPNQTAQIQITDDFISSGTASGAIGQLGWTLVTGTAAVQASTGQSRGVIRLNSTTANNGTAALHDGLTNILTTGGILVYEARVQFAALGGTAAAGYTARFGLGDTTGNADQTNGIYFEYLGTVAGTVNWSLKTSAASTRTTTATSVAVAATTYYKLSFVLNSAGNSVGFYINNNYINSIATNIPTATVGILAHITTNASNAAAKSLDMDYVYFTQNFNTVR